MKRNSCDLILGCCISFKSSLCQFAISESPKEQIILDVDFVSLSFLSNWSSWVENPGIWNSQVHCVSASVCPEETCDLHVNVREIRGGFGEAGSWSLSSPGSVAQEVFEPGTPTLLLASAQQQLRCRHQACPHQRGPASPLLPSPQTHICNLHPSRAPEGLQPRK